MRRGWLLLLFAGCQAVFRIDPVGAPGDGSGAVRAPDGRVIGPPGTRIVFVTKGTYVGDLTAGGGGGGALASADSICQTDANGASLPGMYYAWLSTTSMSAVGRMGHTGGPFLLPSGTKVADTWGEFAFSVANGAPHQHAIDEDAMGSAVGGGSCDVWTNTQSDGTPAGNDVTQDCYEWTTYDPGVAWPLGDTAQVDARFTADYGCPQLKCMASARLYCVGQ